MIRSLRFRILLGTLLASTVVLALLGISIYVATRHALMRDFDDSLRSDARLLAGMVELNDTQIAFEFDPEQMPEFAQPSEKRFFEIVHGDGRVLARSVSLGERDLQRPAIAPGEAMDYRLPSGSSGRLVLVAFTPKQDEEDDNRPKSSLETVSILVAARPDGVNRTLTVLAGLLTLLCATAVVVLGIGLWRMVTAGLKPVNTLAEEIGALKETDLARRFYLNGIPTELVPIIDRLNGFLGRLDAAFVREKSFTADVAHELRTPLAGLQSTLEVCRSRPRGAVEYEKAIDECVMITDRMSAMAETLLMLARTESGQIKIDRRQTDLVQMIRSIWSLLEECAAQRGLKVSFDIPEAIVIETDPDKMRIVLQNLLDNAVSYTNEGGQIRVIAKRCESGSSIEIANTGSKIAAGDVPRTLERFWRGEASRTETETHSGLGLSLASRLTSLLGNELSISSASGGEFVARLHFRPSL
jgi:two-component system sensor histidine kinase QseC